MTHTHTPLKRGAVLSPGPGRTHPIRQHHDDWREDKERSRVTWACLSLSFSSSPESVPAASEELWGGTPARTCCFYTSLLSHGVAGAAGAPAPERAERDGRGIFNFASCSTKFWLERAPGVEALATASSLPSLFTTCDPGHWPFLFLFVACQRDFMT